MNARPNSFCCFTWINGVDLRYGSTADQGRTGREDSSSRLWRPARALGTHAKQGPSTGHSAVGLRQAGNALLTPRPHFTAHHARLVTRWFVLRTALLFVRSAVRLVYAELPGPVAVCSPKQALRELGDRVPGWRPGGPGASRNRPLPLRDNNNDRVRETCSAPATPTSASSRSTDRVRRNHRVSPAANNHTSVDH